jgi:hypothetical protein
MRRAAPVALALRIVSFHFLRSVPMLPNAQASPVSVGRHSASFPMAGRRSRRLLVAGSAAGSNDSGCRGSAPTEAPHTRWRGLGPGTGRTAATGSASGPAITLDNRRWRRAINVATSITPAESIVLEGFSAGADRSCAIIRRHSCAWQAVSDSQARSCGSSSRPSGVIMRSPRKEKPAQGPVKSIRWCGSNSIMPRSHPWPGFQGAGKSRARGPAIARRSRRRRTSADRSA